MFSKAQVLKTEPKTQTTLTNHVNVFQCVYTVSCGHSYLYADTSASKSESNSHYESLRKFKILGAPSPNRHSVETFINSKDMKECY